MPEQDWGLVNRLVGAIQSEAPIVPITSVPIASGMVIDSAKELTNHVVILFEGWNKPWSDKSGKTIPIASGTTIGEIGLGIKKAFEKEIKLCKPAHINNRLFIEAYATDTDDDVKGLAIAFIKKHLNLGGKVIIQGFSWGGDTAVELTKDLYK